MTELTSGDHVRVAKAIHLKCKTCGIVFESCISTDKRSFETLILADNVHQCPKGHHHSYDKRDYFF